MKIAVPKERLSDEMRVAASPDSIKKLSTLGFSFSIETGAGDGASFSDEALKEAGAEIASNARAAILGSDLILKVRGRARTGGGLGGQMQATIWRTIRRTKFSSPVYRHSAIKSKWINWQRLV